MPKGVLTQIVLNFRLVAKPKDGEPPVPICEFYTASHDPNTIEMCLSLFMYK